MKVSFSHGKTIRMSQTEPGDVIFADNAIYMRTQDHLVQLPNGTEEEIVFDGDVDELVFLMGRLTEIVTAGEP